jgi:hypothetical protein
VGPRIRSFLRGGEDRERFIATFTNNMGSYSYLRIEEVELDWMKNHITDHGWLFEKKNKAKIPYYYADDVIEYKRGYQRKLKEVIRRLELSGYSIQDKPPVFTNRFDKPLPKSVSNKVYERLKRLNLRNVKRIGYEIGLGPITLEYNFGDAYLDSIGKKYSINILKAFTGDQLLRIFAENEENHDLMIRWEYADIVDGGYVRESEITNSIGKIGPSFLIITEGSSDTFVIQKAMEILWDEIKNFFYFIDMTDNYPFTGTGNLYRFCQGLAKINYSGRAIVIFDNDTEGVRKYHETLKLKLPENISVIKLPSLKVAEAFKTLGPTGEALENINGRALSIELFLDLKYKSNSDPIVRWTNFDEKLNQYQGSLINKDEYIRHFKSVSRSTSNYDMRKLEILLESIYAEGVKQISTGSWEYIQI